MYCNCKSYISADLLDLCLLLMFELTASADSAECFCFRFGILISYAFGTFAINTHIHTMFTFTYTLHDWMKRNTKTVKGNKQWKSRTFWSHSQIHNGTACDLIACPIVSLTMFCTALSTLNCLSWWEISGHHQLLDRFLWGIFTPYYRF